MIYFLSVLQLLFLLITVSSKQCHERNVIQVTGAIKESSQTGYYYGSISTPNFPLQFPTPFNISYVIDASYQSNDSQINVYLTQMYLSQGVRFFQRPYYKFCDQDHYVRKKQGPRHECGKPSDQANEEMFVYKLHDVVHVSTSCPYLEIEVTIPELYGYHYRTRDPFLFDVYGFNITFEIVPEKLGPKNDSCSPRNCSNLGHCYLAENWSDFFCACAKNTKHHPGRYCEFSPHCDPENNITFCYNGGKCRILGSGEGYCECGHTEYGGARCEKRNEQPKVSARTGCSGPNECPVEESKPFCSSETHRGPCSCRPTSKSGRVIIPKDWVKYEATISIYQNYTIRPNQTTYLYGLQANISQWFKSNNLSDLHNILVSFDPPPLGESHPRTKIVQIHFHGPRDLKGRVRPQLNRYLFTDEGTVFFRSQIPLVENSLELYTMPRVKYKSIEASKQSRLIIGKSVSLTCTAVTGLSNYFSKRDIHFRWFKDGLPVNTSIATRHMPIFQTPTNGDETMSILMIDPVSAYDAGIYGCEVTDTEFGDRDCGYKEIEVILPPQIEIEPMSLTLEKRKLERGVVITCTDGSYSAYNPHNKSTEFVWSRSASGSSKEEVKNDDVVVLEDITPQGKLLRILRAEHSESFTCSGFNKDGQERSKIIDVKVLDSKNAPSCKPRWEPLLKQTGKENKLWWELAAPNSVAKIPCPKGFNGYVQRPCLLTITGKVQWGRSDFSRCISENLKRINQTLQNIKRGFGDWQTSNALLLMSKLEEYLNANQILYPGEGEKIIAIMEDIVKYAFHKGQVNGKLFQVFFETVVKLLRTPNSCVQEKSVLTLCQIIEDMAVRGAMQATANNNDRLKPHIVTSEVLMLQTLAISAEAKYQVSYQFPQKTAMTNSTMAWLNNKLRVNFPLDSDGLRRDTNSPLVYYLIMAAYKNVSSLLIPSETFPKRITSLDKRSFRTSIELISPIVQISIPEGYYLPTNSHIKIHFNLSKEHRSLVSRSPMPSPTGTTVPVMKGTYYSCGVLDNSSLSTKIDHGRLRWIMNACTLDVQHYSYVECQCETLGIFGLLKVSTLDDEIPKVTNNIPRIIIVGFSFCILSCVLTATILSVYVRCRISLNSLYALKLFDTLFIFSAVFIVLLGRTEIPSASWLVWSASACSFLISSLSIQVTKVLRILLMEITPNLSTFAFPWLKNVSQISLLSAITFSTVLPVWTATVAKIVGENSSNESAFQETSNVIFIVFVGTVGLVVPVFLVIYCKAALKTKRELDGCRQQNACSANNAYTSEMIWVLTYRMKTLNRSLSLTLTLLVLTLGIVLYENIPQSILLQYFLGFSATAMGIVLILSYVAYSEYPIYLSLCKPEKPLRRDPEKSFSDSKGSQRKLYPIPCESTANGSIVGTIGLLPPPPPPILRTTGSRHFGEECETQSVSTLEEQSMDTFSTEMSFRAAPPVVDHKIPQYNKKTNRSMRSTGSTTRSSNGSSCRGSRRISNSHSSSEHASVLQPIRGKCFINSGDYIMPSIRSNSINDRPALQSESSATSSGSYNNYLPIHDQEEIQKKISHDLSILLPLHE